MAGESLAGGRLSAITDASSAAAGCAFWLAAFIIAVLDCGAAGFSGAFAGGAMPPLIARSAGWGLPAFAGGDLARVDFAKDDLEMASLLIVLLVLSAFGIILAPCLSSPYIRLQCNGASRYDSDAAFMPFMSGL